jgi:diacylglycerol kinase family enzyme
VTRLARVKRALLIVNPYSTSVTRERVAEVEEALRARVEVATALTEAPGHATELAAGAAGAADAVVVFSGDGTYNEVVNGVDGALPLGFLPGGGTSVLPRALGLPRDAVAAARAVAAAIAEGRTRRIGLGRVNGRRFTFSAGVGFDAELVRRMDTRGRTADGKRPGDLAFVATVFAMFGRARFRFDPAIEVVGRGRAAPLFFVANGRPYSYAGALALPFAQSEFEQGLAFTAPRAITPASAVPLALRAFRGTLDRDPRVLAGHDLDRIEVRCDRPLPLQADGEDLGDVDAAVFEAERDAVSVLV